MKKIYWLLAMAATSGSAFAQEGMAYDNSHYKAFAAALCITLAAIAGAFAQSKAASVALEGIARNPAAGDKLFTPMIIALALIESLVVYALVIAFMIKP
jgi:F-type H+-transporting ATPase subunit c